ncbi:MAG: RDD family protein [Burkholderiales bacterium]|nr:RDD family protein [Burkholderiales bacterium]
MAALVYESLLLIALLFAATAVFVAVFGDSRSQPTRTLLQVYLLSAAGMYFVWSWTGGRRTLPMKTWHLRLVDDTGQHPTASRAVIRFLAASLSLPVFGLALWWALIDAERRFLHDRIAGTRLVTDAPARPVPPRG